MIITPQLTGVFNDSPFKIRVGFNTDFEGGVLLEPGAEKLIIEFNAILVYPNETKLYQNPQPHIEIPLQTQTIQFTQL